MSPLINTDGPAGAFVLLVVKTEQPGAAHVLQEVLEESGYNVQRLAVAGLTEPAGPRPAVILLELAQGSDLAQACEWARQLLARPGWAAVPLLMLGLDGSAEQRDAALAAGAMDGLSRPMRALELLPRLALLMQGAASAGAEDASGTASNMTLPSVDVLGHASLLVHEHSGRCIWHTARARSLMADYFSGGHFERGRLPPELMLWLHRELLRSRAGGAGQGLTVLPQARPGAGRSRGPAEGQGSRRLNFDLHGVDADLVGEGHCLIVLRETDDWRLLQALVRALSLSTIQAQLLLWLTRGSSPTAMATRQGRSQAELQQQLDELLKHLALDSLEAAASLGRSSLQGLDGRTG
ncbi:hypothetical protein [Roseateles sp. PN1]|uniref:hypothetical protein n=1 Tax=Roseateles sp. PN1 TaxID=3137372 RepID=UPI003138E7F9